MLQTGDRILFIDNTSLRNKTINEINHLLKTTDEVVKLKIKKVSQFATVGFQQLILVYNTCKWLKKWIHCSNGPRTCQLSFARVTLESSIVWISNESVNSNPSTVLIRNEL